MNPTAMEVFLKPFEDFKHPAIVNTDIFFFIQLNPDCDIRLNLIKYLINFIFDFVNQDTNSFPKSRA